MGAPDLSPSTYAKPPADELAQAAKQAITTAALRLAIDPTNLAKAAAGGELAEVVLELRLARHALAPEDRQRVEDLLRRLGALP